MRGGIPLVTLTVAAPSLSLLQVTLVEEDIVEVGGIVLVILTVAVFIHPLVSVRSME